MTSVISATLSALWETWFWPQRWQKQKRPGSSPQPISSDPSSRSYSSFYCSEEQSHRSSSDRSAETQSKHLTSTRSAHSSCDNTSLIVRQTSSAVFRLPDLSREAPVAFGDTTPRGHIPPVLCHTGALCGGTHWPGCHHRVEASDPTVPTALPCASRPAVARTGQPPTVRVGSGQRGAGTPPALGKKCPRV